MSMPMPMPNPNPNPEPGLPPSLSSSLSSSSAGPLGEEKCDDICRKSGEGDIVSDGVGDPSPTCSPT